jgi:predicted metalloprotease with PDZ domain
MLQGCRWRTALLAGLLLAAAAANSQTANPAHKEVSHQVSFPALRQQYVEVVSEFPVAGDSVTLIMSSWAPGAYRIRDFAANLDRIDVLGGQGEPLPYRKVAKDAWQVQVGGQDQITVRYSVHAADLSVSSSYVSQEFVLLNGTSVFLYTEQTRDLPQTLLVDPGPGGGEVMTSLQADEEGPGWRAVNFDELVDSPLVVAGASVQSFSVKSQEYQLVQVGDTNLWDLDQSLEDVRKIVKTTNNFWRKLPFERPFWFFNFLVERSGGLEHDHSTVLMSSRWQMRNRADYIKWLSLVAHEYFHAWNVRRLRPSDLGQYDYRSEQYSGQLWLAEGITSYYDDLLLSRAGVIQPAEYFERLALQFHTLEMTPGRRNTTLDLSSRDAWIRQYQPRANTLNSSVSYYVKGAVMGFALDTRLRQESAGRRSLDDVMRLMYEDWSGATYPEQAFFDAVENVGGQAVSDWVQMMVNSTADPDIDVALDWFGLTLLRDPAGNGKPKDEKLRPAGFGINWSDQGNRLVVESVILGLAASDAGIQPGDELLAINDERVTKGVLEDRKSRLNEGMTVEFLVSRNQRILSVPVTLGMARPTHYEIGLQDSFRDRNLNRMSVWLGQELVMPR